MATQQQYDVLKTMFIKADARSAIRGAALYRACLQLGPLIGRDARELAYEIELSARNDFNLLIIQSKLEQAGL